MATREIFIPRTRLDLVLFLKRHNFNVSDSTDDIMKILGLDEDKRDLISSQYRKISAK